MHLAGYAYAPDFSQQTAGEFAHSRPDGLQQNRGVLFAPARGRRQVSLVCDRSARRQLPVSIHDNSRGLRRSDVNAE